MNNALLTSFGLDFLDEDENTLMGFVSLAAQKGKPVNGYYGMSHIDYYYKTKKDDDTIGGDSLQIICNVENIDGNNNLASFDVHDTGNKVWEFELIGECNDEEKRYKGQRQIIANKANGKEGLLVVNVMNPDVLPSYKKDEKIKLQMKAIALDVDYYDNEEELLNSSNKNFKIGPGLVMSSQYLFNHQVLPEGTKREIDYSTNDISILRGKVKAIYVKDIVLEDGNPLTRYLNIIVETQNGDIDLIHSISQIKEDQRNKLKQGSEIVAACVLQGDAYIYDYENGIVLDNLNNIKALNFSLSNGEVDRLNSILCDDVVYDSKTTGKNVKGKDAVINFLKEITSQISSDVERNVVEKEGYACIKVDYKNMDSQEITIQLDCNNKISGINIKDWNDERDNINNVK